MSEPIRIGDLSIAKLIVDLTDNPRDEEYRQMVIYEIMKRCGEPINKDQMEEFCSRMKEKYDKKILTFPKRNLPWPEYIL